ncbi:MAG: hypothetical protein O2923_02645 [Verrucomicrobia bacterium]|nr:hypothetical protein [Verrucomicrobiota bacterium]MDA1086597.1 hypothetical protein [Verrucomicrobiota bacterium]
MHDTTNRQTPRLCDPALTLDLAGPWQVRKWPFDADEQQLAAPGTDDGDWESISQPGKIFYADPEAEGREIADWNRVTLTHIDPEDGAVLRRKMAVPSDWRGKRIILRFDAVFPAGRFYINGHLLGEHMSGLTPVEFDVSDHVAAGTDALVAVRLIRRHPFVQMDMVRHSLEFGGLAQSALLFAVEPCHMVEHHLICELDAALTTGTLAGSVTVANRGASATSATVAVTLSDADGTPVASAAAEAGLAAGEEAALPVMLAIQDPLLWNDEVPNLYSVAITLQVESQAQQHVGYRAGFRRLDLTTDGPRLNGHPVKFRGVNHLTFHPDHGMHTPEPWLRQNLMLMKRANVNAIRTHYTGPRCLSDLCDELGIYLMQELAIDWGTDYIHDPQWVPPALLRIEGGVRRDRHHPSLMVWSVGNENMAKTKEIAEAGWDHLRQFDALAKQLDPSRPTMFPPPGPANAIKGILELRVGDIADTHYSFDHIKRFLADGEVDNPNSWEADMVRHTREWALHRGWSGCWFSSEYGIFNGMPDLLHSPYASIIDDVVEDPLSDKSTLQAFEDRLRREWGLMRDDPTCLGGAFFPWLCCGAGSADGGNPWGWVRWGEDADWGVVTADLLPKPFFWAMRVLFSPVWFPSRLTWSPGDTELCFTVENQYNSIDLKDCTLRVQQAGGGDYMTMMRKFQDVGMACAPGAAAEIRIPIDEGVLNGLQEGRFGLCRCTLLSPDGFRPVTAEILILPAADLAGETDKTMTIGPDAVLE